MVIHVACSSIVFYPSMFMIAYTKIYGSPTFLSLLSQLYSISALYTPKSSHQLSLDAAGSPVIRVANVPAGVADQPQ